MKIDADMTPGPLKLPADPADRTKTGVASPRPSTDRMRKACQEFEAVLIRQMLSAMRSSASTPSLDGGSVGRTYREMLDSELADRMAEAGGMGIANVLYRYLVEQGDAAKAPAPEPPPVP